MTTSTIHPLGPANRHYWQALGMAKTTGADLPQAMAAGWIDQSDWADMVQRCRGCQWADGCASWLAAQGEALAEVPRACPNAAVFDRIRAAC